MPMQTAALVLNYRTAESTYECLESLAGEGIVHALVIDNSEDGGRSAADLAELHKQHPLFPEMLIETPTRNLGFAAGVNLGLRTLRERLGDCDVLLINSDAKAVPGMLKALKDAAASAPAPALVEAGELDASGRPRQTVRYYHRALGLFLHKPVPGTFRYLSGCCLLITSPYLRTPLYDESFFFYGEDVDLSWRLRRSGAPLLHCDAAWVLHAGGRSSKPNSYFYEYNITRCHLTLARKLALGDVERGVFFTLRVFTLTGRALIRSIRTRRLIALTACWRAFQESGRPSVTSP